MEVEEFLVEVAEVDLEVDFEVEVVASFEVVLGGFVKGARVVLFVDDEVEDDLELEELEDILELDNDFLLVENLTDVEDCDVVEDSFELVEGLVDVVDCEVEVGSFEVDVVMTDIELKVDSLDDEELDDTVVEVVPAKLLKG